MKSRRQVAGLLGLFGGLLMVASGYASHGLLFTALGYASSQTPAYLSGFSADVTVFALSVLELVIALGGLTVMAGGALLLLGHRTFGRALLFLGGGTGFLGILVGFGLATFRLGLDQALSLVYYWLGLGFAVLSRSLAKGS